MEAFEHVVKVYLEDKGYIVTSGVKFPVQKEIVKEDGRRERQTHGYEVDLVAAKAGSLVLGSVKSFLGSVGVQRSGFEGLADPDKRTDFGLYRIFNDDLVREGILSGASSRYGFSRDQIEIALFVGKFKAKDEPEIRSHLENLETGGVPVRVVGLTEIVGSLLRLAKSKTYINDPVIVTLKALDAAGVLVDTSIEEVQDRAPAGT